MTTWRGSHAHIAALKHGSSDDILVRHGVGWARSAQESVGRVRWRPDSQRGSVEDREVGATRDDASERAGLGVRLAAGTRGAWTGECALERRLDHPRSRSRAASRRGGVARRTPKCG